MKRKESLGEGDRLNEGSDVLTIKKIHNGKFKRGKFKHYEVQGEGGPVRVIDENEMYYLVKENMKEGDRGRTVLTPEQVADLERRRVGIVEDKVADLAAQSLDTGVQRPVDLNQNMAEVPTPTSPGEGEQVPGHGPGDIPQEAAQEAGATPQEGRQPDQPTEATPPKEIPAWMNPEDVQKVRDLGYSQDEIAGMDNSKFASIRGGNVRNPAAAEQEASTENGDDQEAQREEGTEERQSRVRIRERSRTENGKESSAQSPWERSTEATNIDGDLSPEDEKFFKKEEAKATKEASENLYVYGADKKSESYTLNDKEKEDFKNLVDVYIYQRDRLGQKLNWKENPLHRAILIYRDTDRFTTVQDTKNAIQALRMMKEEGIPEDSRADLDSLRERMVSGLQAREQKFLNRLLSRFVPGAREKFAREHELGEKTERSASSLLKEGLAARRQEIVEEAAARTEKPAEEQSPQDEELINFAGSLMNNEAIDPEQLEQNTEKTIEMANNTDIDPDKLQGLVKAFEAYNEDKENSEKKNSLLYWLLIVLAAGSFVSEVAKRA